LVLNFPLKIRKFLKEEIVKSMKKGKAGFVKRYGERAKEVMYATATKRAKEMHENNILQEHHAYDVHLDGKHIDTIFYNSHEDPQDVKRSLVHHDGYHPNIHVSSANKKPGCAHCEHLSNRDLSEETSQEAENKRWERQNASWQRTKARWAGWRTAWGLVQERRVHDPIRGGDAHLIHQQEDGLALHELEADVRGVRQAMLAVAVHAGVRTPG
jgi:hypothetical protein